MILFSCFGFFIYLLKFCAKIELNTNFINDFCHYYEKKTIKLLHLIVFFCYLFLYLKIKKMPYKNS